MRHFIFFLLLSICLSAFSAKVEDIKIDTDLLPWPMDVTVITPDAATPDQRFPSVYLLNGYTGHNRGWVELRTDLPELADRYGMVMVMPHGHDSWYWDSPTQPQVKMESFFIDELVPYIDAHYPTVDNPAMRAISGLSMGGHGALWLAMRHSDVYSSAGSMSGGVDIRPFPDNWKMKEWLGTYEDNPDVWDAHTVINLVPRLKKGQLNITFDCGVDDFFAKVNDNLHKALLDAGIPHDYTARPGAHTGEYWRNSILYHLLYFNEVFNRQQKAEK